MAYEITWQDVIDTAIDIADDLDLFTPSQQNRILNFVNNSIAETKYGVWTFDARCYYAAHWANMAITPPAGEGTRASESVGSVSTGVTLAVNNPPPEKTILETQYGRSFWHIMQRRYVGAYAG